MEASCWVHWPSSSSSRRLVAFNLKWNWHFGQTFQLASRSFFQTMARQASHLIHSPSVLSRRSSGGVAWSIGFFSRLNQAIREVHSRRLTVDSKSFTQEECGRANNQCPAAPVYPWYRGVSPRASRSQGRPAPPVWDERCAPCR